MRKKARPLPSFFFSPKTLLIATCLWQAPASAAVTYSVNTHTDAKASSGGAGSGYSGDLRYVLSQINAKPASAGADAYEINFDIPSQTLYLNAPLPVINQVAPNIITFNGNGVKIDGQSQHRGLVLKQGNVKLRDLTLAKMLNRGNATDITMGGALLIDSASVILSNVSINDSTVQGEGALGGGILIHKKGSLTVQNEGMISGNTAYFDPKSGRSTGAGLFIMSEASLNFAPRLGHTQTIVDSIGDDSATSLPTWHRYPKNSGGRLIMNGPGTLVLSGANTYHGGTILNGGTLLAKHATALGTGVVEFNSPSTLALDNANLTNPMVLKAATTFHIEKNSTSTLSGALSGTGELTIAGGEGTLILRGNNAHSGGTTLSGIGISPILSIDSVSAIGTGSLTFRGGHLATTQTIAFPHNILIDSSGGTLSPSPGTTATFNSLITGNGPLKISGGGRVIFTNYNPYTGTITLQGGSLSLLQQGSIAPEASIAMPFEGENVFDCSRSDNSSITIGNLTGSASSSIVQLGNKELRVGGSQNTVYAGIIQGSGKLVKQGSGKLTLSNPRNKEASWETHILQGILSIGQPENLGTGNITLDGGGLGANADHIVLTQPILIGSHGAHIYPDGHTLTLNGSIQGSGDFHVASSGILMLRNSGNSYTGTTLINAGTLCLVGSSDLKNSRAVVLSQLGKLDISHAHSTITLNNLSSNTSDTKINLGNPRNTLILDISEPCVYTGALSGQGSLIKQGSGEQTLSGPITYTGTTVVKEGTLIFSGTSALHTSTALVVEASATIKLFDNDTTLHLNQISGSGQIHVGSKQIILDTSGREKFSGVLFGSGSLIKKSKGYIVLEGIHHYTGPTYIQDGRLALENRGSIAKSSQVFLEGEGVLDISQTTFGAIVQDLQGSERTQIHLGTQQLSVITTTDSLFAGQITGKGGKFAKIGPGTMTLTNPTNSHTGGTIIDSGTLQVSDRAALGSGPVSLRQSGKLVMAGMQLEGNGTFSLSDLSDQKQPTVISSGSVTLRGFGSEDILVSQGAALEGSLITKGALIVEGTLSSESSKGFLSAASLIQKGILSLEVDPQNASRISITGPASIGGVLQITTSKDLYEIGKTYTILSAHSLTGHFDGPSVINSRGLQFSVDISNRPGLINLKLLGVACPTTSLHGNNLQVANYLNTVASFATNIQPIVADLANLSTHDLEEALETISPARFGFATYVSQNTLFIFENIASSRFNHRHFSAPSSTADSIALDTEHLFCAEGEIAPEKAPHKKDHVNLWISGFGQLASEKEQHQTPGFTVQSGGVLAGADVEGSEHNVLGLALGYAKTDIHEKEGFGSQQLNTGVAAVYSTFFASNFFFESAIWGSYYRIHGSRNIFFSGFDATAKRKSNGYQVMPHFKVGYDIKLKHDTFTPFINIDWAVNFENKFQESQGASLNMQRKFHTSSMLRTEVGLNAYQTWKAGKGLIVLKEKLAYLNQIPFGTGKVSASIVGQPGSFGVETLTAVENLFAPGLELVYESPSRYEFSIGYDGEFGVEYQSNVLFIKFGKSF